MASRRGGRRRRKANPDRRADPSPTEGVPSRAEQLEYIADMLQQLKIMSAQADCPALTELLERAHREAAKRRFG
jgi:hypothetical protein